jgi:hypothetical protein
MDAGELGRQTAANLHAAAVALGDDPWDPYAFVLAEAARQGLTVERVAPGFDMLDGGRASFDPEGRLIFHESCGTPFEEAFLVAHEIGHVVLGDDPDKLVVNTVDLARPTASIRASRTTGGGSAARFRWTCSPASCSCRGRWRGSCSSRMA